MTPANGQQPHILAINYSPDLLQNLLTDEGYRVTIQSHLERDLQTFDQLAPDLIVIDYMWATTDDNWSLLQLLRLNLSTKLTPIVLCTGAIKEAEALKEHLRDMRIDVVLKPFDLEQLLNVTATALARYVRADVVRFCLASPRGNPNVPSPSWNICSKSPVV
jgi:CheY-like chemotaxis protein